MAEPHKTESRPLSDLSDAGLLWLINRVVFHPRGFALALNFETGEWQMWADQNEPWAFTADVDNEMFLKAENFLAEARAAAKGE